MESAHMGTAGALTGSTEARQEDDEGGAERQEVYQSGEDLDFPEQAS